MQISFISVLITLFFIVLAINVFFRIKVIRAFNKLKKSNLVIDAKVLLDPQMLETQIIPKYPAYETQIRDYVRYLKRGFAMTSVLLVLVISMGIYYLRTK